MDDEPEVEFSFEPRLDALADRSISREEFDRALGEAIEQFDESGPIEAMLVTVRGLKYELTELARVFVRGEIQALREFFAATDEAPDISDSN